MLKIILSGCNGRMGKVISEMAAQSPDYTVAAGFDLVTDARFGYPVYAVARREDFAGEADVVVDFTNPEGLADLLDYCVRKRLPLVLATTGHSAEQTQLIKAAAKKIAVFKSGNMSLGVNLLIALAKNAARFLGEDFNVEIIEKHHNKKIDAPSGTALMLADAVASAEPYDAEYKYDRRPFRQPRSPREIGIHSVRAGTIVGVHEVIFAGHDEVIELSHSAASREVFASGALRAAAFLRDKPPGQYDMEDLVGSIVK